MLSWPILALYIPLAIGLHLLAGKRITPGPRRTFWRATVIALFCSITLHVSEGAVPFFALPVLINCLFGLCQRMYGPLGFIRYVLLPVVVEWAAIYAVCIAVSGAPQPLPPPPDNGQSDA